MQNLTMSGFLEPFKFGASWRWVYPKREIHETEMATNKIIGIWLIWFQIVHYIK